MFFSRYPKEPIPASSVAPPMTDAACSSSMSDFGIPAIGYRAQDPEAPDAEIIGITLASNIVIFSYGNTGAIPWSVQPYYSTNLPAPVMPWEPVTSFDQTRTNGTNAVSFSPPLTPDRPVFYRLRFTKP